MVSGAHRDPVRVEHGRDVVRMELPERERDHSAATETPPPDTPAQSIDLNGMASLNREFAYNDPQKGGGTGEGGQQDRNVELLVPDPRARYPRPKGATPLRVSLVPAFTECTAPNRTHAAPLSFSSCHPPTQTSTAATVGTPDATARPRASPASPSTGWCRETSGRPCR